MYIYTITRYVQCFAPAISTSKNLFKEIKSANSNAPGRSTSFEKMIVKMKCIYKMKSLKGHYTIN